MQQICSRSWRCGQSANYPVRKSAWRKFHQIGTGNRACVHEWSSSRLVAQPEALHLGGDDRQFPSLSCSPLSPFLLLWGCASSPFLLGWSSIGPPRGHLEGSEVSRDKVVVHANVSGSRPVANEVHYGAMKGKQSVERSGQLAKYRVSNNVGGVKHFWGALARALRRAPFRSR